MEKHQVHTAALKDVSSLVKFYFDALNEEIKSSPARHLRTVDEDKHSDVRAFFRDIIQDSSYCVFVLRCSDSLEEIGYMLICKRAMLAENPSFVGFINGIYVIPKHRGTKAAHLLMEEAMNWFRTNQISVIELNSTTGNIGAEKFWKKWEFSPLETVLFRQVEQK